MGIQEKSLGAKPDPPSPSDPTGWSLNTACGIPIKENLGIQFLLQIPGVGAGKFLRSGISEFGFPWVFQPGKRGKSKERRIGKSCSGNGDSTPAQIREFPGLGLWECEDGDVGNLGIEDPRVGNLLDFLGEGNGDLILWLNWEFPGLGFWEWQRETLWIGRPSGAKFLWEWGGISGIFRN